MNTLYFKFARDDTWYVKHNMWHPALLRLSYGIPPMTFETATDIMVEDNTGSFYSYKDRFGIFKTLKNDDLMWIKLAAQPLANR